MRNAEATVSHVPGRVLRPPQVSHAGDLNDSADLLNDGGAHFAMCDRSVRFLSYSTDKETFVALGSHNGNEVIGGF